MKPLKIINRRECMAYLNNRFILNYNISDWISFTVVDDNGNLEKFRVCLNRYVCRCTDEDYWYSDFIHTPAQIRDYLQNQFGYSNPIIFLYDFFNLPSPPNDDFELLKGYIKIGSILYDLRDGTHLSDYYKPIQENWMYGCAAIADDNHAWRLAGGKIQVERCGNIFRVIIRTTASRYDIPTLVKKLSEVKHDVDKIAINALINFREFKKLGLKPGYYRADNITLTKDRQLVYVFDLKDRIHELLKENEKDVE